MGTLEATVSSAEIKEGNFQLTIARDFRVMGRFQGVSEQRPFRISFSGEIDASGHLAVDGEHMQNSVRVEGTLSEDGVQGVLSGSIHERDVRIPFHAR